jgi:hypothetical protein
MYSSTSPAIPSAIPAAFVLLGSAISLEAPLIHSQNLIQGPHRHIDALAFVYPALDGLLPHG